MSFQFLKDGFLSAGNLHAAYKLGKKSIELINGLFQVFSNYCSFSCLVDRSFYIEGKKGKGKNVKTWWLKSIVKTKMKKNTHKI